MNPLDQALYWQDEILQVMYWMRGEHLGQAVTLEQLNRFLHLTSAQLETALQQLLALRLLQVQADTEDSSKAFVLTERGVVEGKRRFLDEFSAFLGKESHLTCDDPGCACHAPDWDGICHVSEGR